MTSAMSHREVQEIDLSVQISSPHAHSSTCNSDAMSSLRPVNLSSDITSVGNKLNALHWLRMKWSVLTYIQKCLTVTLVVCVIGVITYLGITLATCATTRAICTTDGCKYESANILQNINKSIDPCEDFYTFTCDGFIKRHQIPQDKSRFNTFDIIRDEVDTIIYDLFIKDEVKVEAAPLSFIRSLYLGCTNSTYLQYLGLQPLHNYFNYVLQAPTAVDLIESKVRLRVLLQTFTLGDPFIVSISILSNPFNTSEYAVSLDAPSFGIDRMDLILEADEKAKKVVVAYTNFIHRTFKLLNIGSSDVESLNLAKDIIQFETKLAHATTPPEVRRNHRETIKQITLAQLNTHSNIDWIFLLNTLVNVTGASTKVTFTGETNIIINDLPYINRLSSILDDTNVDIVNYYMVWRVIQSIGFMSTEQFRSSEATFFRTQQGTQKSPPLKERCSDLLRNIVPSLIGRIFVDGEFSETDKSIALEIIKDILDAFVQMVHEKDWMDDVTKLRSINKAKAMKINIGYPDWIKNDTDIERVYNFTLDVSGDRANASTPLDMVWLIKRCSMRDQLSKLGTIVDSEYEWPMSPALVNAAYDPTQNTITFPAAILRGVYFNATRPKYSNYAGIGSIIGHEITHGFDDEGSQYDETGNLVNWWSNETLSQFQNKSQCLIDQYASIRDSVAEINLNGRTTLGENIADCGGIREAYRAYFNRYTINSEAILPDFTDYTPDQLLFIAHGNNWCGKIRPEKLRQVIQTDPHAPSKYRANLPLSNFDQFARAFNCSTNSTMNPTNKCVLW